MNIAYFLPTLLTLHLTALIIMAGTTFIDYLAFQTFWELFDQDKERSAGVLQATARFSRLLGIAAAVLILTGIGMMAVTHGVFGEQLWFRIKFVLVLGLIANGLLGGRRQGVKLRKLIPIDGPAPTHNPDYMVQISRIRTNLNRFHIAQLFIFFIIIILSVFKFN
jgi:hypothetical protein